MLLSGQAMSWKSSVNAAIRLRCLNWLSSWTSAYGLLVFATARPLFRFHQTPPELEILALRPFGEGLLDPMVSKNSKCLLALMTIVETDGVSSLIDSSSRIYKLNCRQFCSFRNYSL